MERVKLDDREFDLFIPYAQIKSAIKAIATKINSELEGEDVLFICILNGFAVFSFL